MLLDRARKSSKASGEVTSGTIRQMEEYNSPSNLKGLASDVNDNKIRQVNRFLAKVGS
jgi:hypothetical protein